MDHASWPALGWRRRTVWGTYCTVDVVPVLSLSLCWYCTNNCTVPPKHIPIFLDARVRGAIYPIYPIPSPSSPPHGDGPLDRVVGTMYELLYCYYSTVHMWYVRLRAGLLLLPPRFHALFAEVYGRGGSASSPSLLLCMYGMYVRYILYILYIHVQVSESAHRVVVASGRPGSSSAGQRLEDKSLSADSDRGARYCKEAKYKDWIKNG